MPSERQSEANRRNGRLGGPKTEHGKRRSRRNSLRHGLTSTTLVVLPEENGREYEEILRGFRESLQPGGAFEDALVASPGRTGEASARAVSKPACWTSPPPLNAISQGKSSKTVLNISTRIRPSASL